MSKITSSHLELDVKHLPGQTASFTAALAAFLANQEDGVPWLRISNLRMMAQGLKVDYERIDGLLEILENQAKDKEEEG